MLQNLKYILKEVCLLWGNYNNYNNSNISHTLSKFVAWKKSLISFSGIAGVPTQYGLYGSFLGCIVYIFFGSCKDVPMGPTAISSLLTFQAVRSAGPEYAILLSFLTGLVQVLMGLFGLGKFK